MREFTMQRVVKERFSTRPRTGKWI